MRLIRWITIVAVLLLLALVLSGAVAYIASERKLSRRYDVTPATIAIPTDTAAIARGEYLARAVTTCALCHADDFGAAVYADMGAMGVIAGPNLTGGQCACSSSSRF